MRCPPVTELFSNFPLRFSRIELNFPSCQCAAQNHFFLTIRLEQCQNSRIAQLKERVTKNRSPSRVEDYNAGDEITQSRLSKLL